MAEWALMPRNGTLGALVVLRDGLLIVYCGLVGFVAAGIAASFYKMVTSEAARFALLGQGWLAAVSTFLFFAVTGPAIIMDIALKRRRESDAATWLVASLFVAGLWSVCSGILVLGLVLSLKSGFA
jgi:hypothetical protein